MMEITNKEKGMILRGLERIYEETDDSLYDDLYQKVNEELIPIH